MKKIMKLLGLVLLSSLCMVSCKKNTVNTKMERPALNYSNVLYQMRSAGFIEIKPSEIGFSVEKYLTPNYSDFKIFRSDSKDYFIVVGYERLEDYFRVAAECDKNFTVHHDGENVSYECSGTGNTCHIEIYMTGPNNIHFNIIVCHIVKE